MWVCEGVVGHAGGDGWKMAVFSGSGGRVCDGIGAGLGRYQVVLLLLACSSGTRTWAFHPREGCLWRGAWARALQGFSGSCAVIEPLVGEQAISPTFVTPSARRSSNLSQGVDEVIRRSILAGRAAGPSDAAGRPVR